MQLSIHLFDGKVIFCAKPNKLANAEGSPYLERIG